MEVAVVCLAVACTLLSIVVAILAGSVPYLWHKAFKLDVKVEQLDETLSALLESAGVPKDVKQ